MITVHPRIMERMQARIDTRNRNRKQDKVQKPPSGVRFRK